MRNSLPLCLCLVMLPAVPALAAPVTLCGPAICYEYDNDPGVNAGILSFGTPTLLAGSDVLQFTPTSFVADSDPATAIPGPTVSAIFQFTRVYATDGSQIANFTISESGDYQIIGSGAVNVNLRLQVVDQEKDSGTPGFPETLVSQFNWNTSTATGFGFENWSLVGSVSPADLFEDPARVLGLQIQNVLQAFAGEGGYAYVAKKLTLTTATVVPVPAAALFFGSALGLLTWFRRRSAPASL